MNGITVMQLCKLNYPVDIKICAERAKVFTYEVRLISCSTELGISILVGIDRNCIEVKIMARAENSHSDLTAVGHKHFFKIAHRTDPPFYFYFTMRHMPGAEPL